MSMDLDPEGFPVEADRLAVALDLDYSLDSVARVQEWLGQDRADPLVVAAGCYVGEVLRRNLGGTWQADGTLAGVGRVVETFPLAKARAGDDLVAYVADVVRYAG
jgi:class 3 adenylate cyclase